MYYFHNYCIMKLTTHISKKIMIYDDSFRCVTLDRGGLIFLNRNGSRH